MSSSVRISAAQESWPIAGDFTIARGSKTSAEVVVAKIHAGNLTGRGECLPYPRFAETPDQTLEQISQFGDHLPPQHDLTPDYLLRHLPAGAARNALDCALWDLRAQRQQKPVWQLAGLPAPAPVVTAFTISLDTPEKMQANAQANAHRPLLKVKLGQPADDAARLRAVRGGAPDARMIIDANEGWSLADLQVIAPLASDLGVEMIEQPLPAAADAALENYASPVALGADESMTPDRPLADLARRYQVVNVKLDKTGGLTCAIATQRAALGLGMSVMIGCMVATSLSMAPALLLAQQAKYVDLDGPLLLAHDRKPGLEYQQSLVSFPLEPFWGNVQGSHDQPPP